MFQKNKEIKNILYNLSYKEEDFYNASSRVAYETKLYNAITNLEVVFNNLLNYFPVPGYSKETYQKLIFEIKEYFLLNQGTDNMKLFYKKYISNMSKDFIDSVNNNYKGYYIFNGFTLINPKTLNELLHLIHFSFTNNETNYELSSLVDEYKHDNYNSIKYYGIKSSLADDLYERLKELKVNTHILNLRDKTLIMLRDIGHATVFELTSYKDGIEVDYFIPKVTNIDMVRSLFGLYHLTDEIAKGCFLAYEDEVAKKVVDLAKKIPTDLDRKIDYTI